MNISNAINLARYLFIKNPSVASKVVKITQGPYRSSCPEVSCKKIILSNFAKLAGKQLCQSLFLNEVADRGLQLKKRLWHRCSPVNFTEFLRTTFLN